MTTTVSDIIQVMDRLAPAYLAEEWDNPGLQIGDCRWPVKSLAIALDASLEVIEQARQRHADMLITHHPLFFTPLRSIDVSTSIGAIIKKAVQYQMAIFTAHTNLDKSKGGLNDMLAHRIGLRNLEFLHYSPRPEMTGPDQATIILGDYRYGMGRIGVLQRAIPLRTFALKLKKQLKLRWVKFAGRPDLSITTVAICTGSGSSLLKSFLACGAQVYISGDLRYHDVREIENAGLGAVDIGHFGSEHLVVQELVKCIQRILSPLHPEVTVTGCDVEKDPFNIL